MSKASRGLRRDSKSTRSKTVNKPVRLRVSRTERAALLREYRRLLPDLQVTDNKDYFCKHAQHYGCDPTSLDQAETFDRVLQAVSDGRHKPIAGMMADAFILAKLRHRTKLKRPDWRGARQDFEKLARKYAKPGTSEAELRRTVDKVMVKVRQYIAQRGKP